MRDAPLFTEVSEQGKTAQFNSECDPVQGKAHQEQKSPTNMS
jgi:hypothetical protein